MDETPDRLIAAAKVEHPVLLRYRKACEWVNMWYGLNPDEPMAMNQAILHGLRVPPPLLNLDSATLIDDMALAIEQLTHEATAWNTRTPAATVVGWRPIAEAPRDGRELLLFSRGVRPYVGYFQFGEWNDLRSGIRQPTHFQPLPAPPAGDG
jgi:hypothetical protein